MKLSQIDNITLDYKTMLAIRQESKDTILAEAADKRILVDYSALENDSPGLRQESVSLDEFFGEGKDLEI